MTVGVAPAVIDQIASRLIVGIGEGAMMAAAVLWLLRLSGPARRGRTLGAGVPDRLGARTTLTLAAPAAAAGPALLALTVVVPGVVLLGAGQALAVPALGLLALANVEPARHGAAAGLFFWFDAGVGLGGPAAGALAQLGGPTGALIGAAVAVACTAPIALLSTGRSRGRAVVN